MNLWVEQESNAGASARVPPPSAPVLKVGAGVGTGNALPAPRNQWNKAGKLSGVVITQLWFHPRWPDPP